MTKPRKKTDRWRQVFAYLCFRFPTPFRTVLVLEKQEKGNYAETYELDTEPRVVYVSVDPRRKLSDGIHDILHEYAHAMVWPVSGRQFDEFIEHPPEFWAAYGRVYVDFVDDTGGSDSFDY